MKTFNIAPQKSKIMILRSKPCLSPPSLTDSLSVLLSWHLIQQADPSMTLDTLFINSQKRITEEDATMTLLLFVRAHTL